ncbi:hypothetical protein J2046_000312 [Rhizobium petrolearium]|nr:hypothetical protein [Neorhizobium petrolearium]
MERVPKGRLSYQASPWPPGQVRLSRASGLNKTMQRGEMITCRGWTPRKNAEGHANAEPHTKIN